MSGLKKASFLDRLISICLDLIIVFATAYLYIFLYGYLLKTFVTIGDFLIGICLAGMLIALIEFLSSSSPGKYLLGLRIKIHDSDWPDLARVERVMIKYGALFLFSIYHLVFHIGPISKFGIPADIFIAVINLYVLFTFLNFVCCFRPSKLALHDQFFGSAVCYTD